jgi:hypothetical protein
MEGANGNGLCIKVARMFPTQETPSELTELDINVDVLSETNKKGERG